MLPNSGTSKTVTYIISAACFPLELMSLKMQTT